VRWLKKKTVLVEDIRAKTDLIKSVKKDSKMTGVFPISG